MKAAGSIVRRILAGSNVAVIIAMALVGFSDRLNPVDYPIAAPIGLAFPFFIALNILFTVAWVIIRPRYVLIPASGFLLCYVPIRTYSPLNIARTAPEDAIKVVSYNVYLFYDWEDMNKPCGIVDYLKKQDADIVCLFESGTSNAKSDRINAMMGERYGYYASAVTANAGDQTRLYSKFPIVGQERIEYVSDGNHSTAFFLDMHGDTVIFIANHFESICLTRKEKRRFSTMITGGMDKDAARAESRMLFRRLKDASVRRAPQADAVARYIDEHSGESILLCGDFNDSPISYVRHTLAKRLNDCYVAAGNGPGISYHDNKIYVRIDNIMCSDDWTPYECEVDNTISASDHYPIICKLKRNGKAAGHP